MLHVRLVPFPIPLGLLRRNARAPSEVRTDPLPGLPRFLAIESLGGRDARDRAAVLGDYEALALFGAGDKLGKLGLGLVGADGDRGRRIGFVVHGASQLAGD